VSSIHNNELYAVENYEIKTDMDGQEIEQL
jgi:hypothetical protein